MCVCVHILFHFLAPFSILVFFLTEKFTISSHKKRMHFRYMWYNHSLIETMKSLVCGGGESSVYTVRWFALFLLKLKMISLFSGSKHFVRNILLQSYLSVFVCEFRKKQKFGTFDLSFQQLIIIECVCVCMICAVEKATNITWIIRGEK